MSISTEPQPMIKFGNNSVFDKLIFNKFSNNGTRSKDNTICYINNDINDLEHDIAKINNSSYKTQVRYRIEYYNEFIKNICSFTTKY